MSKGPGLFQRAVEVGQGASAPHPVAGQAGDSWFYDVFSGSGYGDRSEPWGAPFTDFFCP